MARVTDVFSAERDVFRRLHVCTWLLVSNSSSGYTDVGDVHCSTAAGTSHARVSLTCPQPRCTSHTRRHVVAQTPCTRRVRCAPLVVSRVCTVCECAEADVLTNLTVPAILRSAALSTAQTPPQLRTPSTHPRPPYWPLLLHCHPQIILHSSSYLPLLFSRSPLCMRAIPPLIGEFLVLLTSTPFDDKNY